MKNKRLALVFKVPMIMILTMIRMRNFGHTWLNVFVLFWNDTEKLRNDLALIAPERVHNAFISFFSSIQSSQIKSTFI